MTGDRTPTGQGQEAIDVAEAARRLGVSHDAIRSRLRRGTLQGEKRGDEWVVFLHVEEHDGQQDADRMRQDDDRPPDALIDQLRDENAYLRDQLDQALRTADRERERADVLMREALQRLEALAPGPVVRQDTGTPRQDASDKPKNADTAAPESTLVSGTEARQRDLWTRLWRWIKHA